MAAANISREGAEALFQEAGLAGPGGLEIAAVNGPGSVSISGPMPAIEAFTRLARKRRVAARALELPYPFHCSLLEPLRLPVLAAFGAITAQPGSVPFISTVTGAAVPGAALDASYWWRNVRQPVLFSAAIETAARAGATVFLEISPRPILHANITDTLREAGLDGLTIPTLLQKEVAGDPIRQILARAVTLGCRVDPARVFGPRAPGRLKLPPTPWQRRDYRQVQTSEAMNLCDPTPRHPLIGARLLAGTPEWRSLIDATLVPYLADHRIDGEVVLPAAALAEMALAVARDLHPAGAIGLEDFDLLQWLTLPQDQMRELSVRLHADTSGVEIWSRPRFSEADWTLHARGRIVRVASAPPAFMPRAALPHAFTAEEVYASAEAAGVTYGPLFQRVLGGARNATLIEVDLAPYAEAAGSAQSLQILHPIALDAAFHAMFDDLKPRPGLRYAYLPVRFAGLHVFTDHATPARARVAVDRETDQTLSVTVTLFDAQGATIAALAGGLFRAVVLERHAPESVFYDQQTIRLSRTGDTTASRTRALQTLAEAQVAETPESWLYLGAFARSLAFQSLRQLHGGTTIPRHVKPLTLALLGDLAHASLATKTPFGWTLAADSGLPPPLDILHSLAAEHPGASADIMLAANALVAMPRALATGEDQPLSPAAVEHFETTSILLAPVLHAAAALCGTLQDAITPETLRVLVAEPFSPGVLHSLAPLLQAGTIIVTVLGVDARRLAHAEARYNGAPGVSFLAADPDSGTDSAPEAAPKFDLAICLALAPLLAEGDALGRALAQRLAPGGLLAILQPPASPAFDCLLGAQPDWFANGSLGRISAARDGTHLAAAAGLRTVQTLSLGADAGSIVLAHAPVSATHQGGSAPCARTACRSARKPPPIWPSPRPPR
jgi:acyl transferase domain-containing protein